MHIFTCQTAQQTCKIGPCLDLRAPGSARYSSLFASPNARGWRAEERMPWISPGRPGCYRANLRAQGPERIKAGMRPRPYSAPRGIAGFRLTQRTDHPGPHPGRLPAGCPGGRASREATPSGAASRPTLMTPHDCALAWTERGEHRRPLMRVKSHSRRMIIHE